MDCDCSNGNCKKQVSFEPAANYGESTDPLPVTPSDTHPLIDTQPLFDTQQIGDDIWNESTQQFPDSPESPSYSIGNHSPRPSSPDWHSDSAQSTFYGETAQVNSPLPENDSQSVGDVTRMNSPDYGRPGPDALDRLAQSILNKSGPLEHREIVFLRRYAHTLVERGDLF